MYDSENSRNVFVIHGRNLAARDAMFQFLRSLRLYPLEWTQTIFELRKATPYIGEVLEKAFSIAQAAVVLMTPDEFTRLKPQFIYKNDSESERSGHQPRPNVLIEAGMALGQAPDQTILVELGKVRIASDLVGRYTLRMDDTAEQRNELATRLQAAGCNVDKSGNDWLKEGDFAKAIRVGMAATTMSTSRGIAANVPPPQQEVPSGLGGNPYLSLLRNLPPKNK